MKYAKIENNEIVELRNELPKSTARTSNFYLLPEEERNLQGWYSIEEQEIVSSLDKQFVKYNYFFEANKVVGVPEYKTITLEEFKAHKISNLRYETGLNINNKFPDYKQRSAALGLYSEEETTLIKQGIQTLINDCNSYEEQINNAVSHEAVNVIEWGFD